MWDEGLEKVERLRGSGVNRERSLEAERVGRTAAKDRGGLDGTIE